MQAEGSLRFCVHAGYGGSRSSQMLAVLLLQFSALCFNFTDPGGKEKRAKEKEKKKKRKEKKAASQPLG
jgi:hypothetical protein